MEKYGFVYIWYDRKHKRFYIGSHWGHEADRYICSSRWMRKSHRRRPEDFKRRIIARVHTSRKDLLMEEERWLSQIKDHEIRKRYYNLTRKAHSWLGDEAKVKAVSEKLKGREPANKGKPNPAHSERMKGRTPWNKGKTGIYTQETLNKMGANTRGKKLPPRPESVKRTVGAKNKVNMTNLWSLEEYREKQSASHLGYVMPQAQRDNISKANKGKKKPPGFSAHLKGNTHTKGMSWWTDGSCNKLSRECPGPGFVRGRTVEKKAA